MAEIINGKELAQSIRQKINSYRNEEIQKILNVF